MKETFELYCNDCDGYIWTRLNINRTGKYIIKCPECDRGHPREISKDGEMIQTWKKKNGIWIDADGNRSSNKQISFLRHWGGDSREIIRPTKSAYSKKPRLISDDSKGGFLADLWRRTAGEKA